MDWRLRAACRGTDTELFFPIGESGPALAQIEEAKAICRRCSVSEKCLVEAFSSGSPYGIWGGLSESERRAMRRRSPQKENPVDET